MDNEPVQEIWFKGKDFADITAATPEEVSQNVNNALFGGKAVTDGGPPSLVSDTLGTSSRIQVVGGTANAALGFPTTQSTGMGNVADIRRVNVAEVKVAVEAQVPEVVVEPVAAMSGYQMYIRTAALGAAASLQVQPGTAAAFGFDNLLHQGSDAGVLPLLRVDAKDPGEYANRLQVETRAATSGEAGLFDLLVFDDGVAAGRFVNLSIEYDHPRCVEKIVNDEDSGSHLIRVVIQPHPTGAVPDAQTVQLAGGDDGLKNLDDNDFVGTKAGKTGLYAFDGVLDLSVLCVPGRATPVVHNAVIQYCEVERDGLVFPVLDPPSGASADGVIDYFKASAGLQNLTEDGAFYWSWPKVGNPSRAVFGSSETVEVPPSGMICGVYVRNDGAKPGGIYTPPGGVENGKLFGVVGVQDEAVLDETVRNRIYPERINPISRESGTPFFLDGTRTMKGDGQFPYIHQKRGVIFIRRSLKEGLVFARHRTNNERLQQEVFRTVKSFMRAQQKNEGVVAFAVEISTDNSRTLSGRLRLLMPEATDWVVIGISQDPDLLGEQLAS